MNATQIQQLGAALSRLRYENFCKTLDFPPNLTYSEDKWLQLQDLIRALSHFDPESLAKLVEAA
jgi:hypothetical protein